VDGRRPGGCGRGGEAVTASGAGTGALRVGTAPEAAPAVAPVLARFSFRFSAGGSRAACLAGADGGLHLETWAFAGPGARRRGLGLERPVTLAVQPVPLDDGRVLLCRNGAGSHQISLVEPRQGPAPAGERVLAVMACQALRLLPEPAGGAPARALAIAFDDRGHTTIWRVSERRPWLQRLLELPGRLEGGVWLDPAGSVLGADHLARPDGGPAKAVAIDLRDGRRTTLLDVAEASNDRLLLAGARSGLLLVSTDAGGQARLGWALADRRESVRFPAALQRPGAQALALSPDGRRVLLKADEGVRSRLLVYDPAGDRLAPVPIPEGLVCGAACWSGEGIRFPLSAPHHPPAVATVRPGEPRRGVLVGRARGGGWAGAHVERLQGAAGPVEAVVYGGRDWRASERVLLALHGGPQDAWRFEFDPLFQSLARAGVAIVAPNQRGSSGYGAAHAQALRGAWGGPDLEDVRRIARRIAAERRELGAGAAGDLALLGVSYGAWLALLAASCEPALWSRCAALAPFLSGPRLHRDGGAPVRDLLERLGGCQELHDAIGPRDLLRLVHGLRARLLLVHGEADDVIPAGHSRALRARLLELGRREGADFDYLEVPGAGHDLPGSDPAVGERLLRFLVGGARDGPRPIGPTDERR